MYSELRKDLVSGDWIVIAPGRASRPVSFYKNKEKRQPSKIAGCPFEDPQKSGNAEPILIYKNKKDWEIQMIPNKYPALSPRQIPVAYAKHGPYSVLPGVGFHDIVVTRDHYKNFSALTPIGARQLFRAFQDRYNMFFDDKDIAYVMIFHNWGLRAGASVFHPHYQIVALPIVPPDVGHSLMGSSLYFQKHKKCVHCVILDYERRAKSRIVFENKWAVTFAPYVSRVPFELRLFPKLHRPYFEDMSPHELDGIADVLQGTLKMLSSKLSGPDYNFFIHTAPLPNKIKYRHYHWHIEILPHISNPAGFELGTGIDINVVDPDAAAALLTGRKNKNSAKIH